MAKNENGYPFVKAGQTVGSNSSAEGEKATSNGQMHSGCGGRGDCLDSMPLAYVYAPDQQFRLLYSAKDALNHGTLFEELYKPMEVYGHEH